jgi:hypothetical protein
MAPVQFFSPREKIAYLPPAPSLLPDPTLSPEALWGFASEPPPLGSPSLELGMCVCVASIGPLLDPTREPQTGLRGQETSEV